MSLTSSIKLSEFAAKHWYDAFKKAPVITSILTITLAVNFMFVVLKVDQQQRLKQEEVRLENLSYRTQVEQLDQTEKGIEGLLNFIKQQRHDIEQAQDTMASLKKEREELKPIVESERAVVEAIFRTQEERNQSRIWKERGIGFALGILASFIASVIWFTVSLAFKKNTQPIGGDQ